MKINRNNYETFFLLYVDNELSAAEKLEVEQFAEEHADLKPELDMLKETVFTDASLPVSFPDKNRLFRTENKDSLVNISNYETYFVQYADDELTNEEKAATEEFVYLHPEFQSDFELMQKIKLVPDQELVFPNKALLYKEEGRVRRVFPIWTRYAAAALVILTAGIFWWQQEQTPTPSSVAINDRKTEEVQPTLDPAPAQPDQPAALAAKPQTLVAQTKPTANTNNKQELSTNPAHSESVMAKKETSPLKTATDLPSTRDLTPSSTTGTLAAALPGSGTPDATITAALNPETKKQLIPIETNNTPTVVYASNEIQGEDVMFSPGKEAIRKTPLRGLLRKAGRFLDKNNPLSEDRAKGGVFTASHE